MSPGNPFGAGPPLRTPFVIVVKDRTGNFQFEIQKPWITWLNGIQIQATAGSDAETLLALSIDSGQGARVAEADAAAMEALLGQPEAGPRNLSDLQSVEQLQAAGAPCVPTDLSELQTLLAVIPNIRPGSGRASIQDTAANAALYPAGAYPDGSLRRETDTVKLFMALAGAWVQIIAPELLPFLVAAATHGALKRDGTGLVVRVGDDSADSFLKVLDEAYGAGWNGNKEVPTKNAIYDKIESLNLDAGTYTPTLTGVANVGSLTAYACQYMRVGNTVTVSGTLDVTPSVLATATRIGVTLPIASNISGINLAGTCAPLNAGGNAGPAVADPANDRAELYFIAGFTTSASLWFTFTYRVV